MSQQERWESSSTGEQTGSLATIEEGDSGGTKIVVDPNSLVDTMVGAAVGTVAGLAIERIILSDGD